MLYQNQCLWFVEWREIRYVWFASDMFVEGGNCNLLWHVQFVTKILFDCNFCWIQKQPCKRVISYVFCCEKPTELLRSTLLHANPALLVTIRINLHRLLLQIQQNGCSLRWRVERGKQTDNHCLDQWSLLPPIVPHATFAIVVASSGHLHNLVHAVITNCQTQTFLCSSRKHNLSDVLTAPSTKKKNLPFIVYLFSFTEHFEIIFYFPHVTFNCMSTENFTNWCTKHSTQAGRLSLPSSLLWIWMG